jgi:hypothetical protein
MRISLLLVLIGMVGLVHSRYHLQGWEYRKVYKKCMIINYI